MCVKYKLLWIRQTNKQTNKQQTNQANKQTNKQTNSLPHTNGDSYLHHSNMHIREKDSTVVVVVINVKIVNAKFNLALVANGS